MALIRPGCSKYSDSMLISHRYACCQVRRPYYYAEYLYRQMHVSLRKNLSCRKIQSGKCRAALNLPYPAWQDFLGNPALTKALLSRLRERCHTVLINGPCLRPQTG